MNEEGLISRTERLLSEIKKSSIKVDDLRSYDKAFKIYRKLKSILNKLEKIKKTMELKGYRSPYRSIAKYSTYIEEPIHEEPHEMARHARYFRIKASIRKNILDRVNSAIASHKIAISNLEEYIELKCVRCGKRFKIYEKCECNGEDEYKVVPNEKGIHRIEIIPYLPLSGDYMVKISKLSNWAREAFKKIVRTLRHEKRGTIKSTSLVIRVFDGKRWLRKKIVINGSFEECENKLRKKYGSNLRIEFMQFHRRKARIIDDRYIRNALALGYTCFCENKIEKLKNEIFNSEMKNPEYFEEYLRIIKDVERSLLSLDPEIREEIKEEEIKKVLKEKGFLNENEELIKEIREDLKIKKEIEEVFVNVPITLLLWDIANYYLCTSYDRRTKHSGPFPGLRPVLDRHQAKIFNEFNKKAVKIIKKYFMEKIEYIPNLNEIILENFKIERKMKGLRLKTDPFAFGAAIVNLKSDIDIEKCSKLFSTTPKNIKREKRNIKIITKPSSDKAKRFLEIVRG